MCNPINMGQCHAKHNALYCVQARVDMLAFRLAVRNCLTKMSRKLLDEALDRIPKSNQSKDEQKIEKILQKFRQQFKFHLLAFERITIPPNA